jgi:hypothetical protein
MALSRKLDLEKAKQVAQAVVGDVATVMTARSSLLAIAWGCSKR